MTHVPFRAAVQAIGATRTGRELTLAPFDAETAAATAEEMVAQDPWHRLHFHPEILARGLATPSQGLYTFVIAAGGERAGVVALRWPWLRGPYLQTLMVRAPFRGEGIGHRVIDWMATETTVRPGNLWVCVSAFNDAGRAFYRSAGFEPVGTIEELIAPGEDEILLRKRLP